VVLWKKYKRLHFIGIGGTGMSGIAEVLFNLGFHVTGCDLKESNITARLRSLGIPLWIGHDASHLKDVDVVVVSTAISSENPEVKVAREMNLPVIPRAEMLAELMRMRYSIAVSGSHGKTTTTSMIAKVLEEAGLDPTIVVGGRIKGLSTGGKLGNGNLLVAEADESDGSFLKLFPTIAVVTNIDREHLEQYQGDFEKLKRAFYDFVSRIPFYGVAILNVDDESVRELRDVERRKITYSIEGNADITISNLELCPLGSEFDVYFEGNLLGRFELNVPGVHNVSNALSVIATALELEIPVEKVKKGLLEFKGVERRFEIIGERDGITVLDDYAHHPTEIKRTLEAVKNFWKGRVVTVFQPHRYTRTKALHNEFGSVFKDTDILVITELYPAGEAPIPGVSEELIYEAVKKVGFPPVYHIREKEEVLQFLKNLLKPGDLLVTLGAGSVWRIGREFLSGEVIKW